MNRGLHVINLVGVLIVAGMCVFQWTINRKLNLEINTLEKSRISHVRQIGEQEKQIQGYKEDLERFRAELARSSTNLFEAREKQFSDERLLQQLTLERDQLKESITNWVQSVATRDARLKEGNERLLKLNADLNEAIRKYNELASNYNVVVEYLNSVRDAKPSPPEGNNQ